jgi:hypothetical protein
LYIDPGTSIVLFSIAVGVVATSYFIFRALFIKIKFVISGKSHDLPSDYHSYVIYNEGKQYANVFLSVLREFENRRIEVLYLNSDREDPLLDMSFSHIEKKYIGFGNQAFAFLNVLQADICLMTTPSLDVYQLKRFRKEGYSGTGKYPGHPVKDLEVIGSSYLDVFLAKMKDLPAEENHPFTVLVSPSWGPGALLSCLEKNFWTP